MEKPREGIINEIRMTKDENCADKEVSPSKETVIYELSSLLKQGKSNEALEILTEIHEKIKPENSRVKLSVNAYQVAVAVILKNIVKKLEDSENISNSELLIFSQRAKKIVNEMKNDIFMTKEMSKGLSVYNAIKYRQELEKGIKDSEAEIERLKQIYDGIKVVKLELEQKNVNSCLDEQKCKAIKEKLEDVVSKHGDSKFFSKLKKFNFSSMDFTTVQGKKAIINAYDYFTEAFSNLKIRLLNLQNNVTIFTEEIGNLNIEQIILSKNVYDREIYINSFNGYTKQEIGRKKELVAKDNEDRFYGNKEKEEQYKKSFLRLKEHEKSVNVEYIDMHGNKKTAQMKTVEDYEEMSDDLEFLRLESYKEKLERVSLYENTRDWKAFSPELVRKYELATTQEERKNMFLQLQEQLKSYSQYVYTYNGATQMHYESENKNILNPYIQSEKNRRIARERKYKEKGYKGISAYVMSVLDVFVKSHKLEIEREIIGDRNEEAYKSIEEQYIFGTIFSEVEQKLLVMENQFNRRKLYQELIEYKKVYESLCPSEKMVQSELEAKVSQVEAGLVTKINNKLDAENVYGNY